MQDPRLICIKDYDYSLPDEKIPRFPLAERDASRLLISIGDNPPVADNFYNISNYLPEKSLLILNNTRVVHARLLFKKESGATIEVFCLDPVLPVNDVQLAFGLGSPVTWKCLVGNSKRWKSGKLLSEQEVDGNSIKLFVSKIGQCEDDGSTLVTFEWNDEKVSFSRIIEAFGNIPLPPYLDRKPVESDNLRYQTIFSDPEGSVAAPTAGLHFTDSVFNSLKNRQIDIDFLTLHVGAGTFKPVSSEKIGDHIMHSEQLIVSIDLIKKIASGNYSELIAVGTTSVRSLESLYWIGLEILNGADVSLPFSFEQWNPYVNKESVTNSVSESFRAILNWMEKKELSTICGFTSLIIAPPYKFRVIDGIVTNFHQPKSTLLLLVSAFTGDKWHGIYNYALENDFRFLSYGDSCLFLK